MPTLTTVKAVDRLEGAIGAQRLGEIFLELGYLTRTELNLVLEYQKQKGGKLGWILATQGFITRLGLYEGLARHLNLPFSKDLENLKKNIDKKLATTLTHEEMVKYQVIPFLAAGKTLTVLSANPNSRPMMAFLHKRHDVVNIKQIVITDLDQMKLSQELYGDSILDISINGLLYNNPHHSAYKIITLPQIIFLVSLLGGLGAWLYFSTATFVVSMLYAVQFFFAIPIFFKIMLVIYGKVKRTKTEMNRSDDLKDERNLPPYTILIAAYKEKEVIGTLIQSIKKIDYPEDKLDIILLLEEHDDETLQAAKAARPPATWRFLILPDSAPRTKPKALNYGLNFARGEYLTIYDAEDIPEPDQLKKAVAAFRTHTDDYICFQAALNYFNKNENFLTKMFTLEYSSWFDCLLPGLFRAELPIPLGGTSNHFDVAKLKRIGAWDPYNVTEDADLGIRASVEGYKVGMIDSTTYEEANSQLPNWIRQRSRWVKGYLQTFLVHSRHPFKVIKAMGFERWFTYLMLIGGTPANFLLSPIMWLLFISSYFINTNAIFTAPPSLLFLARANLIGGNIIVILINMIGLLPRKNYNLIPYVLLSPVYWMLQSAAAYKGLWQLVTKPYYWEKTQHGLSKQVPVSRIAPVPDGITEMIVAKNRNEVWYKRDGFINPH